MTSEQVSSCKYVFLLSVIILSRPHIHLSPARSCAKGLTGRNFQSSVAGSSLDPATGFTQNKEANLLHSERDVKFH